ncbi:MAG: electron transport complex subunit RsxC [Bacteroidales bacterium]|jgi:electron transport complex protein RnfC|nr:electron transport complex subunit RsxC [Bacteroidales bacterium]MDY6380841.1 electron transport complex subunit RsxC [Bacteroidales bacterium]MDY6394193.1 electron transport complex subunit RsxC [Bacteroidales bacterium]MDY6395558.1 electron transport complex subunit RsxC [Bacteroidales bacterium]MDY6402374.1 electron transport complex subunit RsxC [Bacteroidales bacterium]
MKTFNRGGVHPEENKLASNNKIEVFPLTKKAVVFVSQHLGAPATCLVQKGDKVKVGTLLSKAEAFICANTHSPYSGTVTKVDVATDFNGFKKPAIYIDVQGDEWEEGIDTTPDIKREITLEAKDIVQRMKDCGIVGLGGAAFPTNVKYMIPEGKKAEYLIINGVECEPYLTSDNRIMIENTEEIFIGIEIMKKALGINTALVGIENNKPEAIRIMTEMSKKYNGTEIVPLKLKYPQGAEKQLINALTGREVPSGKLPIEVGCVVDNVGTALAIYYAVQKNRPLIDNVLTFTGKSVRPENQKNLLVRVGTPLQEIIDYCGGLPEDTGKLISGGPMMGKAIMDTSAPTVKTTSSILVMNEKEAKRQEPTPCIRCGKCVDACPMGLEPVLLSTLCSQDKWEEAEKECVMDCIECGCCLFTCPANRPLLDLIRVGKFKVGALRRARAQK